MIRMYRYSGAELSYMMVDARDAEVPRFRNRSTVHALCLINAVDGLVIINRSDIADFLMELYGTDGRPADLSADAARCAVAYADLLGVKPFHTQDYVFEFGAQRFEARIEVHLGESKTVRFLGEEGTVFCEGEID